VSVVGAASITALAVYFANHTLMQWLFTTYVPLFNRLDPTVLEGVSLNRAVWTSVFAVLACMVPLYKPRPRRILDVVSLTHKRVLTAGLALATFGYFEWSHRLPRATLVMAVGVLSVALPVWFVWIRRQPVTDSGRTVIVGDDPTLIERIGKEVSQSVFGYVCPTSVLPDRHRHAVVDGNDEGPVDIGAVPDGGSVVAGLDRLGGFSRLDDVLVEQHVDTVILAFMRPDRAEFFGAIDTCHEHGVEVKVHRDYSDSVLTAEGSVGTLVDVDIEPWDLQDYMLKRAFDVLFAATSLALLSPLLAVVALAIKLDSDGPVLYEQQRTAVFGETFSVYKFRSMVENAESETGAVVSEEDAGGIDPRVTRVGKILRRTHIDEVPQLWAILVGQMSVVGPRPERPELDSDIQSGVVNWQKRWFIKPGLTGLAQINQATGHEPDQKIRYDIEYVRSQSLGYDVKIVIRQLWLVVEDIVEFVR
jgi:lipopolysaccharide/colanic/teichoic acid biosynthesis glycosyltransferase